MDKLLEILKGIRNDVDFENNKSLIDSGALDSFDVVTMVGELNDAFDIEIEITDLEPENFNSVEAIWALINRLQND